MKFGFDLLRRQVSDRVDENLTDIFESAVGDSEIEKLFYTALICRFEYDSTDFDGILVAANSDHRVSLQALEQSKSHLILERQVQFEGWRVDFVIYAWTHGSVWRRGGRREDGAPRWRKLIVECDGHDYHERTKEQAARDRARDRSVVITDGYDVFRFTGSELWRDPLGCAEQVCDWASRGFG